MRFIVCGGRKYGLAAEERLAIYGALDRLHAKVTITEIAQGGAPGADKEARRWALARGVPCKTFKADWEKYGRHPGSKAGPIRNAEMLAAFKPDGVVAFPGGTGTLSMIAIARMAKVKVWEPVQPADLMMMR